jgi:signal transduction histidine kinase
MAVRSGELSRWWLDRPLRSKGLAVLAPPVLVLVITVAASFIVERYQVALRQSASAANAMAFQSDRVLTQLLTTETALRGYAITSDPKLLAGYRQAAAAVPPELDTLVAIAPTESSAVNAANVHALATFFLGQLETIESGLTDGSLSGAELTHAVGLENTTMDQLQTDLGSIVTSERAVAVSKGHDINRLQGVIQPVQIIGLLIGVIGGLIAMVLFVRSIVRRMAEVGANARRLGVSEPLLPIAPAADEVGQLDEELRQTSTLLIQRSSDLVRSHASAVDAASEADLLLSRVSHELRTPLTAVMGFGQLIDMSELSEPNAEAVGQILLGGDHMLGIIEEVRIPAEAPRTFQLDLGPVAVGPLVREVRLLLRPLSAARDLTVDGCDDTDIAVIADYHRFKQVLINLLSNAIKYNREHGQVHITCHPDNEGSVRVAVTDTGDGIPPQLIGRVFVPFDRLDAEARGVEGTGIGLSLSKTFVEAMNGAIGVQSTVGTGSTFWVDLPAAPGRSDPVSMDGQ